MVARSAGASLPAGSAPTDDDGFRCYQLAHAALREIGVRAGKFAPLNADEKRWRAEGPRPVARLDTARTGKPWER